MTRRYFERLHRKLSESEEWAVVTLWQQGFDTYAISYRLGVHECVIANDLMHLRREKLGGANGNKAASSRPSK